MDYFINLNINDFEKLKNDMKLLIKLKELNDNDKDKLIHIKEVFGEIGEEANEILLNSEDKDEDEK
jgi:hypothetical protein